MGFFKIPDEFNQVSNVTPKIHRGHVLQRKTLDFIIIYCNCKIRLNNSVLRRSYQYSELICEGHTIEF